MTRIVDHTLDVTIIENKQCASYAKPFHLYLLLILIAASLQTWYLKLQQLTTIEKEIQYQ